MAEEQKNTPDMAASSESEHAPPRKKANVRFAFACAILASMTSILLGYGTTLYTLIHIISLFDHI
jgi:hypothetical protein